MRQLRQPDRSLPPTIPIESSCAGLWRDIPNVKSNPIPILGSKVGHLAQRGRRVSSAPRLWRQGDELVLAALGLRHWVLAAGRMSRNGRLLGPGSDAIDPPCIG
jgi:hypothetical protein